MVETRTEGSVLRFKKERGRIYDLQTGSEWNIFGEAVGGPMRGTKLKPIVHLDTFEFAWAVFKPDTVVHKKK